MTTLDAAIAANFPDNTSAAITPALARQTLLDISQRHYDTRTAAVAATIKTVANGGPTFIRTQGYGAVGDGGGGLHIRVNSLPSFPGYFQSADGAYWQLVPENSEINIRQFGAIPMINHLLQPADGASDDSYAAFLAADKYIKGYTTGSVTGIGFILRIPSGLWFTSKAIQLKRCTYTIAGAAMRSSWVRFPANSDAFIICYTFSCGHDYTALAPGAAVIPGMATWKTDLQISPGNVYRCITGGNVPGAGDTLTGSDPSATYTYGTATFKYETNVGPSSAYDYDITSTNYAENSEIKDIIFWSFWDPRVAPPNNKWPDQSLDLGGQPIYYCTIVMRARARLKNLEMLAVAGFNIAVIANGDRNLKGAGNTNGWDLQHIIASGAGKANLHVSNSDSNAGSVRFFDSSLAGRMGIEDFSFLGDNYEAVQDAYSGSSITPYRQYVGGTVYNGFGWRARLPILGIELWPAYVGEEPGGVAIAGPTIPWIRYYGDGLQGISAKFTGSIAGTVLTVTAVSTGTIAVGNMIASAESVTSSRVTPGTKIISLGSGAGGTGTYNLDTSQTRASGLINSMNLASVGGVEYPDWTATKIFEPCGAWGSNSVNARNLWKGMYIEGGTMPGQPGPRDTVIGGLQQGDVDRTRGALILDDNKWNYLTTYGLFVSPGGGSTNPLGSGNFTSFVSLGGNGNAAETVLQLINYEGHTWALQHINGTGVDGTVGRDIAWRDNTATGVNVLTFTGHSTAKLYGGSAGNTFPDAVFVNNLVIGQGNAGEDGRPFSVSPAVPSSGFHRKGHWVFNDGSGSTATGVAAIWQCTAEGTPGTFKVISVYP